MSGARQSAPGVAEIRLSGTPEDTGILVSVLERLAAGLPVETVGLEILTRSAPYPNRRSPGQRVYLTVRVESRKDAPEAAGSAHARMRRCLFRPRANEGRRQRACAHATRPAGRGAGGADEPQEGGRAVSGDKLIRWTAVAAVLAVAAVAALISYRHAVAVVTAHGEPGIVGRLYPVVIDGLIVAASMVLLDAAWLLDAIVARHRQAAPAAAPRPALRLVQGGRRTS